MLTKPDYLLIGHMTADLVGQDRILGGTVSYAARTVAAFGLKVGVLTSAAAGEPLLQELDRFVDEIVVVPASKTSTFENIYTSQGREQYIRSVASPLTVDNLPEGWNKTPLVHFAPLTGELNPSDWVGVFPNATTLLTGQGLLREWGADCRVVFKRWYDAFALDNIDWLILSEEDIVPAPELEAEYRKLVNHLVMTRAEKGGTHYYAGTVSTYNTPQVNVVNSTGAGDVFAAALLCSLRLFDGDAAAALQVAAILGANAVTRPGWEGAPTPEEVHEALATVKANK